jgi:hypothetical protein
MNDALFVIDAPPRPSNDDINPDQNVRVIAKPSEEFGYPVTSANARLMAESPNLLATLQWLDQRMCLYRPVGPEVDQAYKDDCAEIKAAIAKATGGAE